MNWSTADFAFAAALIGTLVLGIWLAIRLNRHLLYRAAFLLTLAGSLVLIWINGAIGVIGSAGNPANLLFGIVLLIGLVGMVASRFRAGGMSATLLIMAVIQTGIGTTAIALNLGDGGALWPWDTFAATAVFTTIWLAASLGFRMSR